MKKFCGVKKKLLKSVKGTEGRIKSEQQCKGTAVLQWGGSVVQQCSSAAVKQCSSATVQKCRWAIEISMR